MEPQTFLAQEPLLFPGSLRQNLDPLHQHSDAECEAVLQKICDSHHNQWRLDTLIDTGGRNLSQGQRQLIGLSRAVLRRSPVVILDEVSKPLPHSKSVDSYGVFVLFGS
jgi:ABC-type multidrug transport system fused ATPase/permease subunit